MANIQIEIIDISTDVVTAVFYYDITAPQQLSGAADNARLQVGSRLDAPSQDGLKAGAVHGITVFRNIKGKTPAQISAFLQAEYTAYAPIALADYQSKYANRQHLGKAFDGANWS